MSAKLMTFLQHEQELIKELLALAERQQKALITFNSAELEKITAGQEAIAHSLRDAENRRINMLMQQFNISRAEALNMKMSSLENKYEGDDRLALKAIRLKIMALLKKLHLFNNLNRVLANRARNSVRETLSIITNNGSRALNVKI